MEPVEDNMMDAWMRLDFTIFTSREKLRSEMVSLWHWVFHIIPIYIYIYPHCLTIEHQSISPLLDPDWLIFQEWEVDMVFPGDSPLQKSLDSLAVS